MFEDGVSSLQLFSCNRKADNRIVLHVSEFKINVVFVWKGPDILMLLIYCHSMCPILKTLKHDKNSYTNKGTIYKYFRTLSVKNIFFYYAILRCDVISFFYIGMG